MLIKTVANEILLKLCDTPDVVACLSYDDQQQLFNSVCRLTDRQVQILANWLEYSRYVCRRAPSSLAELTTWIVERPDFPDFNKKVRSRWIPHVEQHMPYYFDKAMCELPWLFTAEVQRAY